MENDTQHYPDFERPQTIASLLEPAKAWPNAVNEATKQMVYAQRGLPWVVVSTLGDISAVREAAERAFMYALGVGVATARANGIDVDDPDEAEKIVLAARLFADKDRAETVGFHAEWKTRDLLEQPAPGELTSFLDDDEAEGEAA